MVHFDRLQSCEGVINQCLVPGHCLAEILLCRISLPKVLGFLTRGLPEFDKRFFQHASSALLLYQAGHVMLNRVIELTGVSWVIFVKIIDHGNENAHRLHPWMVVAVGLDQFLFGAKQGQQLFFQRFLGLLGRVVAPLALGSRIIAASDSLPFLASIASLNVFISDLSISRRKFTALVSLSIWLTNSELAA